MRLAVVPLLALVVCGCGGGGSAAVTARTPSAPSSAARPGGLVGAIDLARLHAVCENARQADPLVQAGIDTADADAALRAAADLLVRPPVDPTAAALGRAVRRDLTASRESAAVNRLTAFCRARGG